MNFSQSKSSSEDHGVELAEVMKWAKDKTKDNTLGLRFIVRRKDGNFWYVQIRVMVDGKRRFMQGKSFYDKDFSSYQKSFDAAVSYRDIEAPRFFAEVGYDPTLRTRPKKPPRQPKFTKRKEAKSGLLSNIHYIHLYKRGGKYTRCVLEVTVNIRGNKYHSTAYSYAFSKYGGKEQSIKIAKQDRNKLAKLVQQKAMELNNEATKSPSEIRDIIKAIKINRTPPFTERDPDKFVKRSTSDNYWIVAVRKKIWGIYHRAGNRRFYDEDYGGAHKSKIAARKFADLMETGIINEFKRLRSSKISSQDKIRERFKEVVSRVISDFEQESR
ncbi:MAG: hypothetical protein ACRBF0_07795 [Calditrichia bacterium]